jgi:hypothetical protein
MGRLSTSTVELLDQAAEVSGAAARMKPPAPPG